MSAEPQELFTFTCDCGAMHHAHLTLVGRKARCDKCGTHITIPRPDAWNRGTKAGNKAEKAVAAEQLCSICQTSISADDAKTACSKCGLPFHEECWKENLGCSAYGCENVNVLKAGPDIRIDEGETAVAAHPGAPAVAAASLPVSTGWAPNPAAARPRRPSAKRTCTPLILAGCGTAVIILVILAISSLSSRPSETATRDERPTEAPSVPPPNPTSDKPRPSASRHDVTDEIEHDASRAAAESPVLRLEWPEAEREHAKLFVDGQERPVPSNGDVTFYLPARSEDYRFRLERPGYEPLEFRRQSIEGELELLEYRVEWTTALRIPDNWLQDLAKAKQLKKPILVFFDRSDDEFVCRKLLRSVLLTPQFAGRVGNDFVVVHIDMPSSPAYAIGPIEDPDRNVRLAAEFGVETYPVLYALDDEGRALVICEGRLLSTVQDGLALLTFAQKRLQMLKGLLQTFQAAEGQAKQDPAAKLLDFVAEEDLDRFYQADRQEWQAALPAERRGRLRAASHGEYLLWAQRFVQSKGVSTQQLKNLVAEFDAWAKIRRFTIPDRGAAICFLSADILVRLDRRAEALARCNEGLALAPTNPAIKSYLVRLSDSLGGSGATNAQPASAAENSPWHDRFAVPEGDTLAAGEKQVQERFAGEIGSGAAGRLVPPLLAAAQTESDPAVRYAMLALALRTAAGNADLAAIGRIVDLLVAHYAVDGLNLRAEALARAWAASRVGHHRDPIAQQAAALLNQARQEHNLAAADRVIQIVINAAGSRRDHKQQHALEKQAQEIKAELRKEQAARTDSTASAIAPDGSGNIRLEPGTAQRHGNGIQVGQRGGRANFGFWDDAGAWVSWSVSFPGPAVYRVTASYSSLDDGTYMVLEVAGKALVGEVARTGAQDTYAEFTFGTVEIAAAGVQEVKIHPRDINHWKAVNLSTVQFTRTD